MRPPLLSPLIWTTIATGQPPDVHGVLDFVDQDPETASPSRSRAHAQGDGAVGDGGRGGADLGGDRLVGDLPGERPPGAAVYSDRLTEQLMGLEENRPGLADPLDAAERARRLVVRGSQVTPAMLAPLLPVTQQELDGVPSGRRRGTTRSAAPRG